MFEHLIQDYNQYFLTNYAYTDNEAMDIVVHMFYNNFLPSAIFDIKP